MFLSSYKNTLFKKSLATVIAGVSLFSSVGYAAYFQEKDPAVSNIFGTLTPNTLPKWGNTALTDSAIYEDILGNVGIGTTTPSVSLDLGARTDAILVPVGAESARPDPAAYGMIRYNTDNNSFEGYADDEWKPLDAESLIGVTSSTTGVTTETWLGEGAGANNASTDQTVFIGINAGSGATGATYSNFVGFNAGLNATNASSSNFFGQSAGNGATNAQASNFIGAGAGLNATGAYQSNFLGINAGNGATDAVNSNFMGSMAGKDAASADESNFIGNSAGSAATNAKFSTFIGYQAGRDAINAAYSIFIGNNAGYGDAVDDTLFTTANTSILIGDDTHTGTVGTGYFPRSIAIGKGATSTKSDQFLVAPSYNNWQIAGVDYVMPSAQGAAGVSTVLTNDGAGNLSWESGSASWSLAGNTGTIDGTNFIGTTDAVPLNFRVNNEKAGRIEVSGNTFYGYQSGNSSTGIGNVANGNQALYSNTTGEYNVAVGFTALYSNNTGSHNVATGMQALFSNETGNYNVATGTYALKLNSGGSYNVAVGNETLISNVSGMRNVVIGAAALGTNNSGSDNTVLGYGTGTGITTGSGNTIVGANVTGLDAALTNNIILANGTGAIKAQNDGTDWQITGSLIPSINSPDGPAPKDGFDLGSPTHQWRDLYISGSTIHIGGSSLSVDPQTGSLNFRESDQSADTTVLTNDSFSSMPVGSVLKASSTGFEASIIADDGNMVTINGGIRAKRTPVTGDYTILAGDVIIACTGNVSHTITLPSCDSGQEGRLLTVKDEAGAASSVNKIIVQTADGSGQKIDGANTHEIIASYTSVDLYCGGGNWFVK